MDQNIEVLLEIIQSSDDEVGSIVENARFREGRAKSYVISSIEIRERAILRIHGASVSWCHGFSHAIAFSTSHLAR